MLIASLTAVVTAAGLGVAAPAAAASGGPAVVHVSERGSDRAPGTSGQPVASISRAVDLVRHGGRVLVGNGVYHEEVRVPYRKTVHIAEKSGERAVLDGSRVERDWVRDGDDWRARTLRVKLDRRDPTGLVVSSENRAAAWPALLFVDGRQARQVTARSQVRPGTFYVDGAGQVWTGDDPGRRQIRVSTLQQAVYVNDGHGSSLTGLEVLRYATPQARVAAVVMHGDNTLVQYLHVAENAAAGVSVTGRDAVVRRTTMLRNGQLGLHAHHADRLQVRDSTLVDNNFERFAIAHHAGGMKVTSSRDVHLEGNEFRDNIGNGGWLDESVYRSVALRNRFTGNSHHGLMLELSAYHRFVGNTVVGNGEAGIRILESSHAQVVHNSFRDNRRGIDLMDGRRTSRDRNARGHDRRFSSPPPGMSWDVENVYVAGNASSVAGGAYLMLGLEHDDKRANLRGRNLVVQGNAWHRAGSRASTWFAAWADYPGRMLASRSHQEFRRQTGQDAGGHAVDGGSTPYVVTGSDGFDRVAGRSPAGQAPALRSDVAELLRVRAGTRLPIGPA